MRDVSEWLHIAEMREAYSEDSKVDFDTVLEMDRLRRELEETQRHLLDLLAVIHRDGGHYREEHGAQKAVTDAVAAVCNERVALDEARAALKEIAEHAHAGGLDDETQWQALCAIRRLCLPWWDGTRTNERQAAALKATREVKP